MQQRQKTQKIGRKQTPKKPTTTKRPGIQKRPLKTSSSKHTKHDENHVCECQVCENGVKLEYTTKTAFCSGVFFRERMFI
jgi:hypothetical protein